MSLFKTIKTMQGSIGQQLHVSFLGSCSLQIYAINAVDKRFTHELTGLRSKPIVVTYSHVAVKNAMYGQLKASIFTLGLYKNRNAVYSPE